MPLATRFKEQRKVCAHLFKRKRKAARNQNLHVVCGGNGENPADLIIKAVLVIWSFR